MIDISEDTIRYIQNGEDLDQEVTNRPLRDLVANVNTKVDLERKSTLSLNFIDNDYRVYEFPNGKVEKQLTDVITTTRSTTSTIETPYGIQTIDTNIPKLEYSLVDGSPKGLTYEPTRTNLLLWSNTPSSSAWNIKTSVGVGSSVSDPNGGTTASTITASANNALIMSVVTVSAGQPYTVSVWLRRRAGVGNVNLINVNGANVLLQLTDQWKRYSVTAITDNTNGRVGINIETSGDSVDLYGAQIEAGYGATSYIPTTTAQVTRNLDNYSYTLPQPMTKGSFYVEIDDINVVTAGTNTTIIKISNSSNTNARGVGIYRDGSFIFCSLRSAASQSALAVPIALTSKLKICVTFDSDIIKLSVNGSDVKSVTNTTNIDGLNTHVFFGGNSVIGGAIFEHPISFKDVKILKQLLSDDEMQEITKL